MSGRRIRIGIVGAASLAGKELSDVLNEALPASDVVLLDSDDAAGRITASGDEPAYIQKLEEDSFAGIDLVFFASDQSTTRQYWKAAREAGAGLIDMSYALEAEAGIMVRGPWLKAAAETSVAPELDLTTPAVVAAHPAALMLRLVANRVQAKHATRSLIATVFEPASEHGQAAMDELHQQTVSLLSFQSVPKEQYDAQVAFNLLPSVGVEAKIRLAGVEARIRQHFGLLPTVGTGELTMQLIQAPVFHGYAATVLVELEQAATLEDVEAAVSGEHIDLVGGESDPPSNLSAAGQADVLVKITSAEEGETSTRFWLWLAADNLKLAALNAIACASELGRMRPQGSIQ